MSDDEYEMLSYMISPDSAKLKKTHFISYLFNHQNDDTMCKADGTPYPFHELFDDTLVDIANHNIDVFSVQTGGEEKIRLFDPISQYVIESAKKPLFCRAIINKLVEFSFMDVFSQKYDFFAQIFEYLIKDYKRFFAGVPNIPNKDKDKMAVYLMFIQHILYSLKDTGKAAIVVPTGFITAGSGIPKKIREYIIENRMLRGVISMPSNIFATTGTNVSILFIDCENKDGNVILMDASKLGTKIKVDGKNQRTVLSSDEISEIIDSFNAGKSKDDLCVSVSYIDIENKKLSFSAGQYFDVKIDYVELTPEEFANKLCIHNN